MSRIKKNDLVHVITGKDKGKRGEVIEILPEKGKIRVKGVAIQTRHLKPRKKGESGSIKLEEGLIDLSNVMPVCGVTGKPCRVNVKILGDGTKSRVSNRSGEIL
jgi:large subunit ribosomal protein L24